MGVAVVVTILAWGMRDDDVHAWVFPRVEDATSDRVGEFAAALSVRRDVRILAPTAALLLGLAGLFRRRLGATLAGMRPELHAVRAGLGWLGTAMVVAWTLSASVHMYRAFSRALDDWPVYRLAPGPDILPNMSQGNRKVIRACRRTLPPDARVLVTTDQKPGFISYYLLPRRVYFKTHPGSEFVIPGPSQPLPAYRLHDLDPTWVGAKNVDYVVEYFEAPNWTFRIRRAGPTGGAR